MRNSQKDNPCCGYITDVVRLCPSISNDRALEVLRKKYDKFKKKKSPTDYIIKNPGLLLKINFLNLIANFISKCGTKFALPYF